MHNLGLESFGGGANIVAADVLDGRLARIRPVHFENDYTKEELNYWTITGRGGKTLEPGMKSYTPPFPLVYKRRTYSKNRIPRRSCAGRTSGCVSAGTRHARSSQKK